MPFVPFDARDFVLMARVAKGQIPAPLEAKIAELRTALGGFPEYQLDFFAKRIARRRTCVVVTGWYSNLREPMRSIGISTSSGVTRTKSS